MYVTVCLVIIPRAGYSYCMQNNTVPWYHRTIRLDHTTEVTWTTSINKQEPTSTMYTAAIWISGFWVNGMEGGTLNRNPGWQDQ